MMVLFLQENMMTASNLSICVGPSLLWSSDPAYMMDQSYSKEVSALLQVLVEDFPQIFGPETPGLFTQQVLIRSIGPSLSIYRLTSASFALTSASSNFWKVKLLGPPMSIFIPLTCVPRA